MSGISFNKSTPDQIHLSIGSQSIKLEDLTVRHNWLGHRYVSDKTGSQELAKINDLIAALQMSDIDLFNSKEKGMIFNKIKSLADDKSSQGHGIHKILSTVGNWVFGRTEKLNVIEKDIKQPSAPKPDDVTKRSEMTAAERIALTEAMNARTKAEKEAPHAAFAGKIAARGAMENWDPATSIHETSLTEANRELANIKELQTKFPNSNKISNLALEVERAVNEATKFIELCSANLNILNEANLTPPEGQDSVYFNIKTPNGDMPIQYSEKEKAFILQKSGGRHFDEIVLPAIQENLTKVLEHYNKERTDPIQLKLEDRGG